MAQRKISPKGRRLVERAVRLHVQKATTHFYTGVISADDEDIQRARTEAEAARDALTRRTRESKQNLIEYIAKLEESILSERS
jgi:hypothetical protein